MKIITLSNDHWTVDIVPEQGGSITLAEFQGTPILRPATDGFVKTGDPFETGCFPMIPYSNRIEDGCFEFDGREHNIRRNREDQIYPIHGNGWTTGWTVAEQGRDKLVLSLVSPAQNGAWPWSYRARQVFELDGDRFKITLELDNTDTVAWPAGIGLHPYFVNASSAHVQFKTERMWLCRDDLIPTVSVVTDWQSRFEEGHRVGATELDNCFEGWSGASIITWQDHSVRIHMTASKNLPCLVVYMHPDNDFFCIEPVSHANNALKTGTVPTIIQPGETVSCYLVLEGLSKRNCLRT